MRRSVSRLKGARRQRRRDGSAFAFTDWKDNVGNLNFA